MNQQSISQLIKKIYRRNLSISQTSLHQKKSLLTSRRNGTRPNSVSVEDCSFGDSGKGKITQEINTMLIKKHRSGKLYSLGINGARNTGHEIIANGTRISCHQIPIAVTQEGAIAIISRGKLIHPNDLETEIRYVKSKLGGSLWGTLIIDQNAVVTTDLHSAYEMYTNQKLDVGHGSTGSGVAQGYASWYEKRAVTVANFMSKEWKEIFTKQYLFYEELLGEKGDLAAMVVNRLTVDGTREKKPVGTLKDFLVKLEEVREKLKRFVKDSRPIFEDVWHHTTIPVTFEGAQGGALDPYFGVYPDVTASRPLARISVTDATEGVAMFHEIAMTIGVLKVPYMSSVGSRVHPYKMDEKIADRYRMENDEVGRSTGRKRGIYPIDLVAMKALQRAAGYSYIAVTHLDSARQDIPIEIVVRYINKKTKKEESYRPYQWHWDQVEGEMTTLPSWDGKKVEKAKTIKDLPLEAKRFLSFLSQSLAPVAYVTTGREEGRVVSFLT